MKIVREKRTLLNFDNKLLAIYRLYDNKNIYMLCCRFVTPEVIVLDVLQID